ncbi:MAG: winged helix-turn-helix transcriptional regulator [Chloroflexi bacterium]|nr:winged helix-turn-helix transcriptional regulator [Chloroflexota bacterium]
MALAERQKIVSFKNTPVELAVERDSGTTDGMAKSLFDSGFDQLDRAILEELQVNSRISVADLARKIHLSPPAVHQRIKRLEREGVIQQYVALLNREMVGSDLLCFIQVSIQPHTKAQLDGFQAAIEALSVVLECFRTAGSHDLLLKVALRDHKELDRFIADHLMTIPGVDRIEVSPVLNEMKSTTAFKLK